MHATPCNPNVLPFLTFLHFPGDEISTLRVSKCWHFHIFARLMVRIFRETKYYFQRLTFSVFIFLPKCWQVHHEDLRCVKGYKNISVCLELLIYNMAKIWQKWSALLSECTCVIAAMKPIIFKMTLAIFPQGNNIRIKRAAGCEMSSVTLTAEAAQAETRKPNYARTRAECPPALTSGTSPSGAILSSGGTSCSKRDALDASKMPEPLLARQRR